MNLLELHNDTIVFSEDNGNILHVVLGENIKYWDTDAEIVKFLNGDDMQEVDYENFTVLRIENNRVVEDVDSYEDILYNLTNTEQTDHPYDIPLSEDQAMQYTRAEFDDADEAEYEGSHEYTESDIIKRATTCYMNKTPRQIAKEYSIDIEYIAKILGFDWMSLN